MSLKLIREEVGDGEIKLWYQYIPDPTWFNAEGVEHFGTHPNCQNYCQNCCCASCMSLKELSNGLSAADHIL